MSTVASVQDARPADRRDLKSSRSRSLVSLGLRWLLTALVAILAIAGPGDLDAYAIGALIVVSLGLNFHSPFCLRNYFLAYTVAFFLAGNELIFPNEPNQFSSDALIYVCAFLAGHAAYYLTHGLTPPAKLPDRLFTPEGAVRIELTFWALAVLQLVRLGVLIRQFGLAGFYSGQELAYRIEAFRDSGSTISAVFTFAITALSASATAVHCEYAIRTGTKPRYKLLALVLVGMPLLSLQRHTLILNSVLMAAVFVTMRRVQAEPEAGGAPAVSEEKRVQTRRAPQAGREGQPHRGRIVAAIVMLIVGVLMAIQIGNLRGRSLEESSATSGGSTMDKVLRGEFTPIAFYRDVKLNINALGYRYGANIVGGLVTRFIPRSFWATKPITSQEVYMRELHPEALSRGLSLAPSIFGVAFLNFGLVGTALLVSVLGWTVGYLDRAYTHGAADRIPAFLIVSAWAYSLMRDDLSTSLSGVLFSFAIYRVLRAFASQPATGGAPAAAARIAAER